MHVDRATIHFKSSPERTLVIEPWGDRLRLRRGESFEVVGVSAEPGRLEVQETTDSTVVFGWPGSTVEVFCEGKSIHRSAQPVPAVPPDMSIRQFMRFMGLRRDGD